MEPANSIIYKTFKFIYNFDMAVFDIAWPPKWEKVDNDHFRAKFSECCARNGGFASANAVMDFLGQLTRSNGLKFTAAISIYCFRNNIN